MTDEAEDLGYGHIEAARVEALAGFGMSAADIAHVLTIDEERLASSHSAAIESGRIKANAKVAESLFRKATGEGRESVTAAIFWLKTRARWREVQRDETDRQPVVIQIQKSAADL
jgi:hypothetical protein